MTPLGARLTLKGRIGSEIRRFKEYFTFEMELGGTQQRPPTGCPSPSDSVQYTIFLPLNPGELAHLEGAPKDQIWVVQGDISLDIPVTECPGDIGVIAFQISAAKAPGVKEFKQAEKATVQQDAMGRKETMVAVAPRVNVKTLSIADINLPEKYQNAWLNPEKTKPVREWIQRNGRLDKPVDVTVKDGRYWLDDGYRRFAIAREIGFSEVPVRLV